MINQEGIKYVVRNLKNRKTRTFLTSLSILIGIITIFIFVSFGLGLYTFIDEFSEGSAADKIIIQPRGGLGFPGLDDNFQLNDRDLRTIERVSGVYEATGVSFRVGEIRKQDEVAFVFVVGFDPEKPFILEIEGVDVERGRSLQGRDNRRALLGHNYQIDDRIFSRGYELNQRINLQGEDITIVGFLEQIGNPPDDATIYLTKDYFRELFPGAEGYGWIIARVDIDEIDSIIDRVEDSLRRERGLKRGEEDFFVQSFDDLIQAYAGALNVVIGFIVLIALVSVLVSAINTSNTMITSVLERYKEIGVMKSIGAKNSEILWIFLFESALIGFVAGVIGVSIGAGVSFLGGEILAELGWSFLKPVFTVWLFAGCIAFATITGAISGVVPAIRASKINTVDALRYE